jgi:TetR/AcrR family transcriptional regulator, mexJK operon transcriptional repressor
MAESAGRSTDLSPAKRQQILTGARHVFSELGFERASVDLIAARAGVSKATIYNHFADKKALFVAGFLEESNELREGLIAALATPGGEVEGELQRIGERFLRMLLSPHGLALHRIISSESARFPDLGRALFEAGQRCMHERMKTFFQHWADSGALRIDDPSRAAIHFVNLCKGDLHTRAQLGVDVNPGDDAIRETVWSAVEVFLRAYRPA